MRKFPVVPRGTKFFDQSEFCILPLFSNFGAGPGCKKCKAKVCCVMCAFVVCACAMYAFGFNLLLFLLFFFFCFCFRFWSCVWLLLVWFCFVSNLHLFSFLCCLSFAVFPLLSFRWFILLCVHFVKFPFIK